MNLTFQKSPLSSVKADAAVAFLHEDAALLKQEMRDLNRQFKNSLSPIIESGDFRGKEKEVAVLYLGNAFQTKKLVLVGVGEKKKLTLEKYRRAAAAGAKRAQSLNARSIAFELPSTASEKD
ncbi:MAG TPA: M17 family peptidase N-terminal domain-containing protein, partial [Bacteroidota bacterium]|nr:M17 family peptidase N-terminal domain-containing protein [Bacteroidota bacterium]